MSDSDRSDERPNLGAFGALVALVICCLIVAILAYSAGRDTERRDQSPASYSQAAKADAQSACIGRESSAAFECIYEKVEASQDQARGEQDLTAQQRAASSALASALLAFLTLILSGVGVWYVKRTLDATLKAVNDTNIATNAMVRQNELAEAAQRPWVAIRCEVESLERAGPLITAKYSITYENIGRMLARNFWTKANCRPMHEDTEARITAWFSNARERREMSHRVLLPNEAAPSQGISNGRIDMIDSIDSGIPERFFVIVTAVAHYKTHDDGPWHATERAFTIGIKSKDFTQEQTIAKRLRNGIYGAEKIVVRRFRSGETS